MKKIILLLVFLIMGCAPAVGVCPSQKVYLEGNIYRNGQWTTVFTEIDKGELSNPKNYMTEKQYKEKIKNYKMDVKPKK